jgi:hypothetical protein
MARIKVLGYKRVGSGKSIKYIFKSSKHGQFLIFFYGL